MHDNPKIKYRTLKSSDAMLVQFDSYEERVAQGVLQTFYYKHPFEFKSLDQLLLIIDDVLDSVGFEKDPGNLRYLYEKNEGKGQAFQHLDSEDIYEDKEIYSGDYVNAFRGELIIRVLYRKNSSMQGEIRKGERIVHFRSSLELLKMLHEYLEQRYIED